MDVHGVDEVWFTDDEGNGFTIAKADDQGNGITLSWGANGIFRFVENNDEEDHA